MLSAPPGRLGSAVSHCALIMGADDRADHLIFLADLVVQILLLLMGSAMVSLRRELVTVAAWVHSFIAFLQAVYIRKLLRTLAQVR